MHEAGLALQEPVAVERGVEEALAAIGRNLGWDLGAVWLQEEPRTPMRRVAAWRAQPGTNGATPEPQLPADTGPASSVVQTSRAVWIQDVASEPGRLFGLSDYSGLHSELVLPIRSDSGVLGIIALWSGQERPEDPETAEALQRIAVEVGLYVERARTSEQIRALATPVLTVGDRVLLVPVIGRVTPEIAGQMMDRVLAETRLQRAKAIVIDLTGVAIMDAEAASRIVNLVTTVRLLGARVILTGVSTPMSETLVNMGVDLTRLETVGDLRRGIELAGTRPH
jgi:anti-anti-sigma regulatory factor